MKFKKKNIDEIIDSTNGLIGKNSVPTTGSDLETTSSKTTDQDKVIGHQPFKYDVLSRFGFTLLPFFEGQEDGDKIVHELGELLYRDHKVLLKEYYKNINKLKNDYRVIEELEYNDLPEDMKEEFIDLSIDIVELIGKNIDDASKKTDNIDENEMLEDKMIDEKKEDELSEKSNDNGVMDKKIKKIAGLINKLDKKSINNIIDLLEIH